MLLCSVFGCKSNNNKRVKNALSAIFYPFPKNPLVCKEWVKKCSQTDEINVLRAKICSKHFIESDYEINPKKENSKKRLIWNAVPSQNLFHPENSVIETVANEQEKCVVSQQNVMAVEQLKAYEMGNPSTNVKAIFNKSEKNNQDLLAEIERLRQEIKRMHRKNEIEKVKLKVENKRLMEQINKMKKAETSSTILKKSLYKMFTPGQIRILQDPHQKIIHWKVKDITTALELHAAGPDAYRLLKKHHYPLPGESTLRRWVNKGKEKFQYEDFKPVD